MPDHVDYLARARDYDVMVIGGGGAGVMAAINAAKLGARVCLLEADTKLGGSTTLSHGFVFAADTDILREHGVDFSVDAYYNEVMAVNRGSVDPAAVRVVCEEAGNLVTWLQSIGVSFVYNELISRAHGTAGRGEALFRHLEGQLSGIDVDVALNTRVTKLLKNSKGAVCGAIVDGEPVTAGAVVITSGGYGANTAMLEDFLPRSKTAGDWLYYVGGAKNFGDGIEMGRDVNAAVIGKDQGLLGTGNGFHRSFEVFIPGWLMVVNENGVRFGCEFATYWDFPEWLRQQPNQHGFAIIDSRMVENAKPDRRLEEYYRQGLAQVSWLRDEIKENIEKGKVKTADTLAGLAEKIGVDPDALQASVDRYNGFCETGKDLDFGKDALDMEPVRAPPFVAVEVRNHLLMLTQGGLAIDKGAHVLAEGGAGPIPGLFAAGEVVSNVNGAVYAGTGFSIASALIFGRIAGQGAAAFAHASQVA